jgi:hypothetical protein
VKIEADCSMLYPLVLCLAKRSSTMVSNPRMSIGSAPDLIKEESTVQQAPDDLEMDHAKRISNQL